jgi:tetratricopeptide (TPR) repeat protein
VPSLSLPGPGEADCAAAETSDAVALFADQARAQGTGLVVDERTAPLLVSICRQLDGMPLAIELAAARLRSLSLSDLQDRLGQRFRLLTGGSRTAPERQQTLRATVEWSYSLLTGAEQLLLRRLSVFAEGFDLDAAEAVCGFGDVEVLDVANLLGSLVDKSLVVAAPSGEALRYRLLETIRQFAAERLAETGEGEAAAVAAAHRAHFLSVAETAAPHLTAPDQGRWLARLDADQGNLQRATAHAAADPDGTTLTLRFGVALKRYWLARSRLEEASRLLGPALDRPDARADPKLFTAALVAAAFGRGPEMTTTLQRGEQVVAAARRLGDEQLLIDSLAWLCGNYYFAGQAEKGLPLGQESLQRARRLGDDVVLGGSLAGFLLSVDLIDPVRSGQLFAEAIACTERSGDHLIAHVLRNNAGVHALRAGDLPAARAHLEQAARAGRAIGEESSPVLVNLGWVLRQEGDQDGARPMFEAGLRIGRHNGNYSDIAYACLGLACLAADAGDWHRAGTLHGVAQAFLDRTGQPWQDPEARYRRENLGQLRARLGEEHADQAHAEGMTLSLDQALDLATGTARTT